MGSKSNSHKHSSRHKDSSPTRDRHLFSSKSKSNNKQHHSSHHSSSHHSDHDRALKASLSGSKTIIPMAKDGNCLMSSLSDQLYRDGGKQHEQIRHEICDFLAQNELEFKEFLVLDEEDDEDYNARDFASYVREMRRSGSWGGNLELVAAAKLYRRNVTVYSSSLSAFTIPSPGNPSGPDILLSYHDNDHYNSVRDNMITKIPPVTVHTSYREEAAPKPTRSHSPQTKDTSEPPRKVKDDPMKTTKRNAECPCGSGLRYKKCCLRATSKGTLLKEINPREMEGNFRVLRI